MIDIVKLLREQHEDLGPNVLALRSGSPLVGAGGAPGEADRFAPEVRAWLDANAPGAVLARRLVRFAETAGMGARPDDETRSVLVVAFPTGAELARFATEWT